ncbi:sigma-54-dependent Fis family transcriptional regulator [Macromonas nakdongensis]|uniref:sigma-54-dependent Fis family transcriptional regulator n=1 Tax=Macromonas nakdongensis TaxID=1843082 RepID=UPI000C330C9B|nr:helix-turn-helix domain-containing protein [Macromonas nakdongensis]
MHTGLPAPASPTPQDRLAGIERARQALLERAPGEPAPWLPPWIGRSWRRCLDLGLQPQQRVQFEAVSAPAVKRAIEANQSLLRAAAPVIRSLARAMADTRYFAILTDAQGVVIDVNGPIDRQDPSASAIARVGVNLSEQAVGTTAIGATLAEGLPVWLHRGEHFFDDTSVYSCAGAPLFGPDGQCIGMLDLTGIHVPERPALKHLVTQSARSIENALTLAQPHHLLLRLNWPGRVLGEDSDGLVGLDADGRITAANRAAIDMLNLVPGQDWPHACDVFAVPTGALFDAARQQRGAVEQPLWCGLRLQVLAQPSGVQDGGASIHPASNYGVPLKQVESALIRKAVEDAQGNVAEAARALGISRATVYRKLERR